MALESSSDLTNYFVTDEHAVSATYTVQGGTGTTINGIFDNEYYEDPSGEVGLESSQPQFTCKTTDVSSASNGDTLVVSSTTYTVRSVQDDGTGITLLILEA